jgi:lipopolysaccharide heptosyltransferase II
MSTSRNKLARLGDYIVYLSYRAAGWILLQIPLTWTFRIGQVVGLVGYLVLARYRHLAIANLRIAFPEWSKAATARCAREHFKNLVANLLSSFVLAQKPWSEVARYVDTSLFEKQVPRINSAKNSVWVVNHIGNWELMIFAAEWVRRGNHAVFYQRLRNRFIDEHVRSLRISTGLEMLDRSRGLSRGITILRNGGMVAVLVDQHAGDKGVWVPFFGRLASTTPFPAILAKKTGAKLLPVAITTIGVAKWRVEVGDFIPCENARPEEVTHRINLQLESQIVRNPADWFWVHDRWKTPSPQFLLRHYKRGIYLPGSGRGLKPFRILVRSSNWLGDTVMTVPAIRRIKRGRPDVYLAVLTRTKLADFWKSLPEVDEVVSFEPGESVFRVAKEIRGRFDVAILMPNSPRTGLEVWLAGIPRRVGYHRPWRDILLNQFILEPAAPRPISHQSSHYLRLVERIGADIDEPLPGLASVEPESHIGGLCPGAEYGPAKQWRHFGDAAKRLSDAFGLHWLIFGTSEEVSLGRELAGELRSAATDLTGKTSLSGLMQHLRRCRLLLTNDTGTMHLAAHLGVPTVSVFGSTEPGLTGPIGDGHIVLRHHVECSPCFLRECPLDFRCMNAVTVEEVVAAASRVLARQETGFRSR